MYSKINVTCNINAYASKFLTKISKRWCNQMALERLKFEGTGLPLFLTHAEAMGAGEAILRAERAKTGNGDSKQSFGVTAVGLLTLSADSETLIPQHMSVTTDSVANPPSVDENAVHLKRNATHSIQQLPIDRSAFLKSRLLIEITNHFDLCYYAILRR